jgi:hypothetical protein
MAAKRTARASPELRGAQLSPRYRWQLHHDLGHDPARGIWEMISRSKNYRGPVLIGA